MKVVFKIFSLVMMIVFLSSFNSEKNNLPFKHNLQINQRSTAMAKINSEISPSEKKYQNADTIKFTVNGNLTSDGECTPSPIWGLLVKDGKEWKTVINVKALPQAHCSATTSNFKNETIEVSVIDLEKQNASYYWRFFSIGEYKFTVLSANRERIIESSSFKIQ